MNENENKINGENEQGSAPVTNGDGSVKAFGWEFTENPEQEDQATATEPEQEHSAANDVSAESNGEEPHEQAENSEANQGQEQPEIPEENSESYKADELSDGEKPCCTKEKSGKNANLAVTLSAILSGCAILLLVAIAIAASFGLLRGGSGVIYIPVATPEKAPQYTTDSDMLEDFMASVVIIKAETETGSSVGTGIILSENGYIVTNHHVIENATAVYVWRYGMDTPDVAAVIGHKEMDDIAVLKINKTGLRPATFAKSADCRVGERVYAVGTPEGDEFGWSVTHGIISCPDREIKLYNSDGTLKKKMHVVQTDASVNPGNSGGPLINSYGQVVGIITLKLSDSAGMGFAIPSDGALIDVEAIIEKGHANDVNSGISIPRPLIGITGVGVEGKTYYKNVYINGTSSIEKVTKAYAEMNPNTTFYAAISGVYVSAVSPTSDSASKLREGDIITKVNNIEVAHIYAVMDIINEFNGGDTVEITFWRDGNYQTVSVTLGAEGQ